MMINGNGTKGENTPVRLHLELKDDYLSDYQKRMLRRYGESSTGDSITRDILIPSDMPLHNLHYTIQKLFGWQNSHLRSFLLPDDIYHKLTGHTVRGWSDLVGILFQPLSEAEGDLFWDDDYEKGSINTWLKKKYTGPYFYGGTMEHLEIAKQDVQEMLNHFKVIEVRESFKDYMERSSKGDEEDIKILRRAPLIDLTLEEMNSSLMLEGGTESLLERLEVAKVIAAQGEKVNAGGQFPITEELIYNYDFGDNWIVNITKHNDCDDLLEQNMIAKDELEEAQDTVLRKHKPVCLHKDGLSILDDVGGLGGFADLLGIIYEGENNEERANARAWSKSQGWSARKSSIKTML